MFCACSTDEVMSGGVNVTDISQIASGLAGSDGTAESLANQLSEEEDIILSSSSN